VLNLQRFANGALACHELGWRPAEARVLLQKGAYLWRLMHEAPDRTRRLYEEMHNAPPLKGKAANRAATAAVAAADSRGRAPVGTRQRHVRRQLRPAGGGARR
jgi:hypothetical protein